MQLTGELAPLGYAHRETEFALIPGTTTRLYGACGPTALASCASAARQKLVTTEATYTLMHARGLCSASGVSNDGQLASASAGLGLTIDQHRAYSSDVWNGWQTFLGWHLGSCDHPTLIELAHGQQLHDEISGQGENATNLTYHFICLIKRHGGGYSAYAGRDLPSGYWACDGDNYAGGNNRPNSFNAADALQFYSDATLTAAMPCAGIAFKRSVQAVQTTAPTGGTTMAGVPTGWRDDGATLTAPNGVVVVHGFREWVLAHTWDANDVPEAAESYPPQVELGNTTLGPGAVQFFRISGQLSWTQARGVFQTWNGQELYAVHQALAAAQAEIAALKAAPPPPTPAPVIEPAALTVQQQKDLAAMAAIRAALA